MRGEMMNGVVFLMHVEEMDQAISSHQDGVRTSLLRLDRSWRELLAFSLVRNPARLKLAVKVLEENKVSSVDNAATESAHPVDEDWLLSLKIVLHPFIKVLVESMTLKFIADIDAESITLQYELAPPYQ